MPHTFRSPHQDAVRLRVLAAIDLGHEWACTKVHTSTTMTERRIGRTPSTNASLLCYIDVSRMIHVPILLKRHSWRVQDETQRGLQRPRLIMRVEILGKGL